MTYLMFYHASMESLESVENENSKIFFLILLHVPIKLVTVVVFNVISLTH